MTRRRRLAGVLVLLAGLAAGLVVYLAFLEPFPARAYRRIQMGMTLAEVSAILGGPPGDYSYALGPPPSGRNAFAGPYATPVHTDGFDAGPTAPTEHVWQWNDYWIAVGFDDEGKVFGRELTHIAWPDATWVERVRYQLGL